MSHLNLETLARIVDDGATAEENAHLAACGECSAELDMMRGDVQALSLLPDMTPAPEAWGALERRLQNEGLLQPRQRVVFGFTPMMQMAAALTLFVGGTVAGRMTATPEIVAVAQEAVDRAGRPTADAPARSRDITLAGNTTVSRTPARTIEEAAAQLKLAEEPYFAALTRYAELAMNSQEGDPVARLAALQSIVLTTQAALNQAPTDPLINGYHLTALAQRDATLKHVAATSSDRWY